jgi:hypothetical protein
MHRPRLCIFVQQYICLNFVLMFDKVVQGVELSVLVGFQPVLAAPSKQRSETISQCVYD